MPAPRKKNKNAEQPSEHAEQSAIFEWANNWQGIHPELKLMFAIPNGAFYGNNRGAAFAQSRKLKSEGLRKGVPDIFLACPKKGFHGLFIELKVGKNKPSPEQSMWLLKLEEAGYLAKLCYSSIEAIDIITEYIS